MNGTDYTLYLVFLRYAGYVCLILTCFNLVLLIPIYGTGSPVPTDNWKENNESSMNNWTVLNITANEGKFTFVYLYTMFVVSGIAYCMVIFYQKKYEMYKDTISPETGEFDDI